MSSILKVDEIQNTGGNTGLTIDSSGRVLNPNAVGWFVYKTATQTASGANEILTWQGVRLNQGSGFQTSGGNASKFVAPVHGLYTCHATLFSPSDTNDHDVLLYVNSVVHVRTRNGQPTGHETFNINWVGELNANETLHLAINTSGDSIYGDSSTYWTTWCGHLIG